MVLRRNQMLGRWGEDQACLFLIRQHFVIVERNYHSTRGEIDIVAKKAGDFYFIEVKTRQTGELATDEAVTPAKLYKLRKAIGHYSYHRDVIGGSMIITSLLVVIDHPKRRVGFRMVVIY